MKLTKRLQYLADRVNDEESFIDVAADHGYLALALAKKNSERKIIVSDIAKQPLASAIQNFEDAGIQASFRQGNGFSVLDDNEILDVAIIAGIGGKLIVDILNAIPSKTKGINKLVLSTNVGMHNVRRWASLNQYEIIDDQVLMENGKFYEVVTLMKNANILQVNEKARLEKELYELFGANLEKKMKQDVYQSWITFRVTLLEEQIMQMQASSSKEVLNEIDFLLAIKKYLKELLDAST